MTIIGTAVTGLTTALTTSVGQVRLALGDTVVGAGVRPDGANLSDAEIQYFLTTAGGDVDLATARVCEALSTMWATAADLTVGPRKESLSQVSQRYAERAKEIRAVGGGSLTAGYVSLGFATVE